MKLRTYSLRYYYEMKKIIINDINDKQPAPIQQINDYLLDVLMDTEDE